MSQLMPLRELFSYGDHCNRLVLAAAEELDDVALDQPIDISVGSLRRLLLHLYNGEYVWLQRWNGAVETKWPTEAEKHPVAEIRKNLSAIVPQRDAFLENLSDPKLDAVQTYRDSKGKLFKTTLRRMMLQGIVHSIHHRAQIVNAIRRLGGNPPEMDFMMSVREPA